MLRAFHRLRASGFALLLLAAVALSTKSVLVKLAYRYGAEPGMLLVLRMAFATPLLVGTLLWVERGRAVRLSGRSWAVLVLMGAVGVSVAMTASFNAIQRIDAALATLVTFTYPAMTVLLVGAMYRERIGARVLLSLVATFVGLLVVVRADRLSWGSADAAGIGLALLSAAAFALYNALQHRMVHITSPLKVSAYTALFATVVLVAVGWDAAKLPTNWQVWALAAALGIVTGYLPFLAFTFGVRMVGASRAVIVQSLAPVLTVTWANLILGERLDQVQFVGMALVIGGVMATRSGGDARPGPTAEAAAEAEPVPTVAGPGPLPRPARSS